MSDTPSAKKRAEERTAPCFCPGRDDLGNSECLRCWVIRHIEAAEQAAADEAVQLDRRRYKERFGDWATAVTATEDVARAEQRADLLQQAVIEAAEACREHERGRHAVTWGEVTAWEEQRLRLWWILMKAVDALRAAREPTEPVKCCCGADLAACEKNRGYNGVHLQGIYGE